jgi:hypothetical protein
VSGPARKAVSRRAEYRMRRVGLESTPMYARVTGFADRKPEHNGC